MIVPRLNALYLPRYFIPNQDCVSSATVEYFEQFDFSAKLFNKNEIPNEFKLISDMIRKNSVIEIKTQIQKINSIFKCLESTKIQKELFQKGPDYLQKCLGILFVMAEMISVFYFLL